MQPWPVLLASDDTMKILAIALGGFGLLYIVVFRPMIRKKRDPLDTPMSSRGMGKQRGMEREMQNLLVEYEQMIRNMTAGLDTRAAKLELLIREADEKLATLRTANQNAGNAASPNDTMRNEPREATAVPPSVFDAAPPEPVESPKDSRHAEVYALADQGLPVRAIARRLGQPDGEIELILALRSGIE